MRDSDRQFCQQAAYGPGQTFSVSHGFAVGEQMDSLLALYAFFGMIRAIPREVSDPSVGLAKLAWWRQELADGRAGHSQHPVVRAMAATGIGSALEQRFLDRYFAAHSALLDPRPVADEGELRARATEIGGLEAIAELKALGGQGLEEALSLVGAAAYVGYLIPDQLPAAGAAPDWWIPLDLRARHAVDGAAQSPVGRLMLATLWSELAAVALGWLGAGLQRLARDAASPREHASCHHLLVRVTLERRRLQRRAAGHVAGRGAAFGHLGDVIAAWRQAKRGRPQARRVAP